jgi:hypothetical protein
MASNNNGSIAAHKLVVGDTYRLCWWEKAGTPDASCFDQPLRYLGVDERDGLKHVFIKPLYNDAVKTEHRNRMMTFRFTTAELDTGVHVSLNGLKIPLWTVAVYVEA